MKINTVLFDLGGTIEDVWVDPVAQAHAIDIIQGLLVSYDPVFSIDRDTFHQMVTEGFNRYKQWNTESFVELPADEIWGDWIFNSFHQQRPLFYEVGEMLSDIWETLYFSRDIKAEAKQVLQLLKDEGYTLGVISNTTSRRMPFLLMKRYGIDSFFDCMFLSSVQGIRKPDPRLFQMAMEELHVDPSSCVYVGDQASRDCYGPYMAGFASSILISSYLTQVQSIHDQYVGHRIEALTELPDLLRSLNGGT